MTSGHRSGWVDPYAGQPGRRLFVAVPLPDGARTAIADLVVAVRAQPVPGGGRDVRWVRTDGLHLTMRFLGPTPDARIAATVDAVQRAARAAAPISIRLGGAGTFPPAGRPRAIWVGIAQGAPALGDLAATVERELVAAGWPPDGRAFRAHLTLARADGIPAGRAVADRLVDTIGEREIATTIDRIGLYESITGGGPARYLPVSEAVLGS